MGLISIIESCDFVTPEPHLLVDGKARMRTWLGGLCSIFLGVLSVIIFVFFSKNMMFRENPQIIESTTFHQNFETELTKDNFFFSATVIGMAGKMSSLDGLLKFTAVRYELSQIENPDGSKRPSMDVSFIPMTRCSLEHFGEKYKELETINYDSTFCFKQDFNLVLRNSFASSTNNFSFIKVYLSQCDSRKEVCKTQEEINKTYENLSIIYNISHDYLDHKSFRQPLEARTKTIQVSQSIKKYFIHQFNMMQISYFTDEGWILSSTSVAKGMGLESKETTEGEKSNSANLVPNGIQEITIAFNTEGKNHDIYRSYEKIQNIFANVGGFIKGCLAIVQLIAHLVGKTKLQNKIFNECIELYEKAHLNNYVLNKSVSSLPTYSGENRRVHFTKLDFLRTIIFSPCCKRQRKVQQVKLIIESQDNTLNVLSIYRLFQEVEVIKHILVGPNLVSSFEKKSKVLELGSSKQILLIKDQDFIKKIKENLFENTTEN